MGAVYVNPSKAAIKRQSNHVWDIRTVPGTEGRGSQVAYAKVVKQWSMFPDSLPDSNSNNFQKNLRGIYLHSQLCGRTRDICNVLSNKQLRRNDALDLICSLLYQYDPMFAVSDVLDYLHALKDTSQYDNEYFKKYESHFAAQMTKDNFHGQSVQLPESIYALLFLSNAGVDDSQRVYVLPAATGSSPSLLLLSRLAGVTSSTAGAICSSSNQQPAGNTRATAAASTVAAATKNEQATENTTTA